MNSFEKAEKIISDYETRKYRQEDLAKKYNIPIGDIQKITQAYGFQHTKRVTVENCNEGQSVKPLIFDTDISFLEKYGDDHFRNN